MSFPIRYDTVYRVEFWTFIVVVVLIAVIGCWIVLKIFLGLGDEADGDSDDYDGKIEKTDAKDMAYQKALLAYKSGKDYNVHLSRVAQLELKNLSQQRIVKKVKILAAGSASCAACQKLEGNSYTIEEATKLDPIPCFDCTHTMYGKTTGFCRCCYVAEID